MKRRILALVLALVMAVGLALPASAEGLGDGAGLGGDGAPAVITDTPADTDTPTTGDSVPTPPTTGDSTTTVPTPPTTGDSTTTVPTPPAAPVDGEDEDESDTPMPLAMASPMSVGATPTTAATPTTKSVEYVDENGDIKTVTATKVEYTSTTAGGSWSTGWYYVEENTSLDGVAWGVSGDVKLILCDGATLTKAGYSLFIDPAGSSLTIYGQSAQTGKLVARIEGIFEGNTLTINGGVVEATGEDKENEPSCGIEVKNVIVNGGKVTATGGVVYGGIPMAKSYGISGAVTFNGGTLIAKAGSIATYKAAFSTAPDLPSSTYYWRTGASENFTKCEGTTNEYSHNSSNTYVELTTQPSGGGYISYMAWDATKQKLTPAFIADEDTARTVVDNSSNDVTWSGGTAESPAWYFVKDSKTISGTLKITGHVNLILCDGADLTVNGGIKVGWGDPISGTKNTGASLTIYGQTKQTGKLTANAGSDSGGINVYCSSLTVNGGVIEATGKMSGDESNGIYIIGSSSDSTLSSSMTVNSGKVTAEGKAPNEGATSNGIGLHNGTLTLTINGGEVTAIGGASTGTTGCSYGINNGGGTVTITGGKVIAKRAAGGSRSKAVSGTTLNLPTVPYWWRTAETGDSAKYKTQAKYADSALDGTYFELITTQPADSELDRVGYLAWNAADNKLDTTLTYCEGPTEVAGHNEWGEAGKDTWYYVKARSTDNLSMNGTVSIKGNVHLILCDGADLTVIGGIKIENGASLTIYGQTAQSGKANFQKSGSGNGISINSGGSLTINGGEIRASGGSLGDGSSSGIQVGSGTKGTMTVNSGKVTATGGGGTSISASYGIYVVRSSSLTVNGGEVTAIGGAPTGENSSSYGIHAGENTVTINGGTVIAKRTADNGQAVFSTNLNLPTVPYWWRTADSAPYKTQRTHDEISLLGGEYFEVTTTPKTNVDPAEAAQSVDYMDWDETNGALTAATCSDYVPVVGRSCDATWGVMTSDAPMWYYVAKSATIDGTVTLAGDVNLILGDGATLTINGGISGNASDLTIYGQVNQRGKLVTTGAKKSGYIGIGVGKLTVNGGAIEATGADTSESMSCGICVIGNFTINAGAVDATGGVSTPSGENNLCASYGIAVERTGCKLTINGGEVTAKGGAAERSVGALASALVVGNDAKLTATGGSSTDAVTVKDSYGISGLMMDIGGSANVTAAGGTATVQSYGVYLDDWSEHTEDDPRDLHMTSGTLIAKTLADNCADKAAMHYNDTLTTLPETYWWRTAESGSFTGCANGEHPYVNGTNTYAEITSTRPAGWVEPTEQPEDQEQDRTEGSSAQQPIRRQNGAVAALIPTAPDKADVTSPETFDAGIAVYAVMGAMSAAASAAWIGKRKKR